MGAAEDLKAAEADALKRAREAAEELDALRKRAALAGERESLLAKKAARDASAPAYGKAIAAIEAASSAVAALCAASGSPEAEQAASAIGRAQAHLVAQKTDFVFAEADRLAKVERELGL